MNKMRLPVVCILFLIGLILASCAPAPMADKSSPPLYKIEQISPNVIRVVALASFREKYSLNYGDYDEGEVRQYNTYDDSFGRALALGLAHVAENYTIRETIPIVSSDRVTRGVIVIVERKE